MPKIIFSGAVEAWKACDARYRACLVGSIVVIPFEIWIYFL